MNVDNYKFSVLMSLYMNEKAEYLEECLNSLSLQTLQATEIICVFDGPLPTSLTKIVSNWECRLNIKIVISEQNIGLGKALNLGLIHCAHDIVARMDTDDIALPNRFSSQIPLFYQSSVLALLGSNIVEFDNNNPSLHQMRVVPENAKEIIKYSVTKNPFNHMSVVFRKNAVLQAGGYIDHPFMEDYNLWLRLISKGFETKNLPEALIKARIGNSMLKRRSGYKYICSEYKLAKLKYILKISNLPITMLVFFIRSFPRILPIFFLSKIYAASRKNK